MIAIRRPTALARRRATRLARRGLALAIFLVAIAGVRPAAAQRSGDADSAAIRNYTLTMARFRAWMSANRAMAAEAKARAAAGDTAKDDDAANDDESLDQMAARFDRDPVMRKGIKAAGLTAREYSLITLTLMQAMMADGLLQKYPNAKKPDMNLANLEFVKAHRAELEAATKELQGGDSGQE